MKIAKVKFGETHAVLSLGDMFRGKQELHLACHPITLEINDENRNRYTLTDDLAENVGCVECRHKLGIDREEGENAD